MVTSNEQARLRVWISVFNCYGHFPGLSSFTVYEEDRHTWVVEGKSDIAHYGLWVVDGATGEITPSDQIAKEAAAFCRRSAGASFPSVVTADQAALLVWVATYECFSPRASMAHESRGGDEDAADGFVAYQDNPQRWLVEGRQVSSVIALVERVIGDSTESFTDVRVQEQFYGLWMVDTGTGTITAWDDVARATAAADCYQTP